MRSSMKIPARLKPNSRHREEVVVGSDGTYIIYTKAPAIEGRANAAAIKLLAALRGDYGVQPLMLPRANATSSENPWRIYMNIRPAVSGLVVMQAADLYRATTK